MWLLTVCNVHNAIRLAFNSKWNVFVVLLVTFTIYVTADRFLSSAYTKGHTLSEVSNNRSQFSTRTNEQVTESNHSHEIKTISSADSGKSKKGNEIDVNVVILEEFENNTEKTGGRKKKPRVEKNTDAENNNVVESNKDEIKIKSSADSGKNKDNKIDVNVIMLEEFDTPSKINDTKNFKNNPMKAVPQTNNKTRIEIDTKSSQGGKKNKDVENKKKTWSEKVKKSSYKYTSHNGTEKEMFSKHSTIFKETSVSCEDIFNGKNDAIDFGKKIAAESETKRLGAEYYKDLTKDCDKFINTRGYIASVLSKEEEEFPIAYSILAHKYIEMLDRLLRQIYRPQNFYCIHIDLSADENYFKAVSGIVNCFPNVFMASSRIDVQVGDFSVLEPELICMKDLYSKGKWKYFINLSGQEMPLKTNLQLVKILKEFKGANDIQGTMKSTSNIFSRWRENEIGPPPMYIVPVKGSAHIAANREFVNYVLHSETAAKFLDWVKQTEYPEETFFSTLNHNSLLGIPGTTHVWPEQTKNQYKPFLVLFQSNKSWFVKHPCAGNFEKNVCILSTGDLPILGKGFEMFADRFDLDVDRIVVGCLEEKLFNNTRDSFLGNKTFETGYYKKLYFVRMQVKKKGGAK